MTLFVRLFLLAAALLGTQAHAEDRVTLGWGRMFTNDAIGDGGDRWHTGSYVASVLRGPSWSGALPQHAADLWEYRIFANTIAPALLLAPDPLDRRYAGSLTFSATTHFDLGGFETSLGGGITAIGPMTGLGFFQKKVHEFLNMDVPGAVLDDQIGNQIHPYAAGEFARDFAFTEWLALRPFLGGEAGAESLVRLGADVILGRLGRQDLLLREPTTGQLYRGVVGDSAPQFSLVMGADIARVFDSAYFPAGSPVTMTQIRHRLRAGYHWQTARVSVFSGLTYLSPEFEGQPDGQIVGSLSVSLNF
jgi:hypothetical protein